MLMATDEDEKDALVNFDLIFGLDGLFLVGALSKCNLSVVPKIIACDHNLKLNYLN